MGILCITTPIWPRQYAYNRLKQLLLYVHSELSPVPCVKLNEAGVDNSIWCTIPLSNTDKLLVGVVYRAPSSPHDNNQRLLTIINNLNNINVSHILLMGDFNFPSIDWSECICLSGESSLAFSFLDAVQDSFLTQHVSNCTRHRDGQQSSLLDLEMCAPIISYKLKN